jgi:hypothetical protein
VTHSPVVNEKTSHAHALEDGTLVDEHGLYRVDCSCGARGLVWYASLGRALESWRRHLPAEVTV